MATLANLRAGDQFIFVNLVKSVSVVDGIVLELYGPSNKKAADGLILPDGSITGHLTDDPRKIPVMVVTGFTPVSVGDILENAHTGETMVCRWSSINPAGKAFWSPASNGQPVYPTNNWSIIGHVDLSSTRADTTVQSPSVTATATTSFPTVGVT
jgi:hypothetical protein